MRGSVLVLVFALLFSVALSVKAQAQFFIQRGSLSALACSREHTYGYMDSDVPDAIASLFKSNDKSLAYRVCTDYEGNAHTFVRAAKTMSSDICRVEEREIFPGDSGDTALTDHIADGSIYSDRLAGWTNLPPETWLARHYLAGRISDFAYISKGVCPPADSADYVTADHISDGMLRAFGRFWQGATASPEKFEQAFAHVEMRRYLRPPGMASPIKASTAEWIRVMEQSLFGPNGKPLKVWNLGCDADCHANLGEHGIVYFDMGPKGLEVTAVAYLMVI